MSFSSFKKIFAQGIALALPLVALAYVMIKLVGIFEKMIAPLSKKLGVERILGDLTLTIFAVFILLVLAFILGLLMQFSFVSNFSKYLEDWMLKLVPSLNHLKMVAAEKLDLENAEVNWKPVLILNGGKYSPAYIVDETEEMITLLNVKIPSNDTGDVLITKKNSISYTDISLHDMRKYNRQYGKGYISMIEKIK